MSNEKMVVVQFKGTVYENGYGQLAQKVMRDTSLSGAARLIYSYLCSFAGGNIEDDRYAFPSVETIMNELGMTHKTFYKHRNQLIESGYLEVDTVDEPGTRFKRNIYIIVAVIDEDKLNRFHQKQKPYGKNSITEKFHNGEIPSRKNSRTNINKSLKINSEVHNNNQKQQQQRTEIPAVAASDNEISIPQKEDKQTIETVCKSLGLDVREDVIHKLIETYGREQVIRNALFIGRKHTVKPYGNVIGAFITACKDDYAGNEPTQQTAPVIQDERYAAFYELFPDTSVGACITNSAAKWDSEEMDLSEQGYEFV